MDPATLLVAQLVGAISSTVVLAVATRQHPGVRSLRIGMLGMGSLLASTAIFLLRGFYALPGMVPIANLGFLTAAALSAHAFRALGNRSDMNAFTVTVWCIGSVAYLIAYTTELGAVTRTLVISISLASLYWTAMWEVQRIRGGGVDASRVFALLLLATIASTMTVRVLVVVSTGTVAEAFGEPSLERTLAFLPGLLGATGLGMAMVQFYYGRTADAALHLADTDPLTCVLNRRAFCDRFAALSEDCSKRRTGVALLLLDIDHFKHINDQYGHPAGDEVLRAFARRVADQLRPGDIFARLGGEEFGVLCPIATPIGPEALAERLRRAVQDAEWALPCGRVIPVTVSVGIAVEMDYMNLSWDTLLQRADQALYAAKHQGRNCVCVS